MAKNSRSTTQERAVQQDAIALLTRDHETLRGLLSELDETSDRGSKRRLELLQKIGIEIRVHARIEEEIFYPAYKAATQTKEDSKLFFEATEEHGLVDVVLPALEETDPKSEPFSAKAKVLKDLIEHHAEEEETEMFPRAKKLLGKDLLKELGAELDARKQELTAELKASTGAPRKQNGAAPRQSRASTDTQAAKPSRAMSMSASQRGSSQTDDDEE